MHWENRHECPDCRSPLKPVRIVDATGRGMGAGISHVELSYASVMSTQSQLSGTVSISGVVRAKLCETCGRIILYGTTTAGGLPKELEEQ
jgi:hypothetical protein